MKPLPFIVLSLIALGALVIAFCTYTVKETEQYIVTTFGKPNPEPVREAGLKFKLPWQKPNKIEKRILEWDGQPNEMPTKDKTYIVVDTFGRWRVSDPLTYFRKLTTERRAQSRLDDILGSETRSAVANNELIEVVRTTKNRTPVQDETLTETQNKATLKPISLGRARIEKQIFDNALPKLSDFGIELLDLRIKRINYHPQVVDKIHTRMISERQQIAERFRSEGAGEAARIIGTKEEELRQIQSQAYKQVQTIHGEADAKATAIYAAAFNQSPASSDFYGFMRTMEMYKEALSSDTSVILSTQSNLFRYLKENKPAVKPNSRFIPEIVRPPSVTVPVPGGN